MALGVLIPSYGQTIFNCSSNFVAASSGTCSVYGIGSGSPDFWQRTVPGVSGGQVELAAAGATHEAYSLIYKAQVNVQAFTASYTFIPGGTAIGFVLTGTDNQPGYEGIDFVAGAGCEVGFFQAKDTGVGGESPNKVFAISMDSLNALTPTTSFTYSNTQVYQATQNPCKPNDTDPTYWNADAISTSPVPLNSPANAQTQPLEIPTRSLSAMTVRISTNACTTLQQQTAHVHLLHPGQGRIFSTPGTTSISPLS